MRVISESELTQIHGSGSGLFLFLELPHIFMGIREFTNYLVDLTQNGCATVDEDDHFTRFFCRI